MTKKELSQLYYLNREIEHDKRELAKLKTMATSTTSKISGLPHAGGISDKTALGAEIAYLEGVINNKIERTFYEYNRLLKYIENIDDSLVRQIMTFRHINGLTWVGVAMQIGNGNTADGVRMIYNRFLSGE